MASCGESESEFESKSGSENSSSRSEDGKGVVQPVAARAISRPSSSRAKKRKAEESSPESQSEDGIGTVQPVQARACCRPFSERLRKGGGGGKGAGPSVLRIGELFELCQILSCCGDGGGMPASRRKGRHAGALWKLPEEEPEEKDRASMSSLSRLMGLDEEVLRVGVRMIDCSRVEEIKERLREYRMEVLQMGVRRAVLRNDMAKLFMDGYRAARK